MYILCIRFLYILPMKTKSLFICLAYVTIDVLTILSVYWAVDWGPNSTKCPLCFFAEKEVQSLPSNSAEVKWTALTLNVKCIICLNGTSKVTHKNVLCKLLCHTSSLLYFEERMRENFKVFLMARNNFFQCFRDSSHSSENTIFQFMDAWWHDCSQCCLQERSSMRL